MRRVRSRESGLTLLEILISLLLISVVALASGWLIISLGLIGSTRFSADTHRPARLRTLAMEYVQAEFEYLRNWPYAYFRDDNACNPTGGLPSPFPTARQVPPGYLNANEPRLPPQFAYARILISSESVVSPGTTPNDCRPRRITVNVYLESGDEAAGRIFVRGETVRSPR